MTASRDVFLERREQVNILRSHAPCHTVINKMSLEISSSINEAPVEPGSGDRTCVKSMISKEGSWAENSGYSLHLNQFTGHLLHSAERIKHVSHPVHLVPKQVSKIDQDESCPEIPVYLC